MYTSKEATCHVVRGIIYNESGNLLVGQKVLNATYGGGFWSFIGGKVDPTDSSLQAALAREAKEEVGIAILQDPSPNILYEHTRHFWRAGVQQTVVTSFLPALACSEQLRPDPTELMAAEMLQSQDIGLLPMTEASWQAFNTLGLASFGLDAVRQAAA